MKTASLLGFVLIILGVLALAYQGITYTTHNQRGTQHDSVAPDCGRSRVARRNRIGRSWRESSLGNRYVLRLAQRCELSVGHSHFGTLSGV
jgi:hypothetical protein